MKIVNLIICLLVALNITAQTFTEADIKKLAKQIDKDFRGMDLGYGVTGRACLSYGRTLVYQYDVPYYWEPPTNLKSDVINNLKTADVANMYFLNDINAYYYYYNGNSLVKKVSIKSHELSDYNFNLGDYFSIKGHKKSKGVNLKIKPPKGWKIEEGIRPNIVKKFTKDGNSFMLLTKENLTFFTRKDSRSLLEDSDYFNEFINETVSFLNNPKVTDKSIITIDTYPAITFKVEGQAERTGYDIKIAMRFWVIFYEDKIISLQGGGPPREFKALEKLYTLITNSVVFPDQYQ